LPEEISVSGELSDPATTMSAFIFKVEEKVPAGTVTVS